MTAVAGILNKHGVAIAADSAVTVNGMQNRKVYNSANKIFTLSKYHPVGIAIYNNAQFMGIPWEVLIKEYRKYIEKKHFPTLLEYKNDFFKWLKSNKYFIDAKDNRYLFFDFIAFIQAIINEHFKKNGVPKKDIEKGIVSFLNNYIKVEIPKHIKIESLKNLDESKTKKLLKSLIPEVIKVLRTNFKTEFKKDIIEDVLIDAYYEYILHDQFLQFSGLIFTGYGEDELFPRLFPVNVSIVIDGNLRYADDVKKEAIISDNTNSCIRPFAQTDVIDTILQGISPELNRISSMVYSDFINQFVNEIISIKGMPNPVKQHLGKLNIDNYVIRFKKEFDKIIGNNYVKPLMGAVSQLSKEDLAEMAESLVYLTYLKRRFTMAEESVGGPVDIAVITKGDGFIWIKRKHYFDPDLNQNYFKNYS